MIIDLILSKYPLKTTWELVDLSQEFDSWKYAYRIFGDKTLISYKSTKNDFRNNSFSSIDDRIVNQFGGCDEFSIYRTYTKDWCRVDNNDLKIGECVVSTQR